MSFVTDPIGDLLTRMRNAQAARRASCSAPLSALKLELCNLMKNEGYLTDVAVTGEAPKQSVTATFVPDKRLTLERVSKPSRRIYTKAAHLSSVLSGYGIAVLTTSEGLLTDKQARKRKLGGEILCTIS